MPTPTGEKCEFCDEPILEGEQGCISPWNKAQHRECFMRAVLGGIAHVEKRCHCYGGRWDPDGGLSKRESAKRVMALMDERMPKA